MDKIERITALHRILKAARYPVTVKRLQEELGCSRATAYRDLAYLRDALMAPVEGDGEAGFRYQASEGERFELPGLWLSSEELYALLAAQQLLVRTGGGVLSGALAPLQKRIEGLLADHAGVDQWPVERVRVIPHRGRKLDEASFRVVASAVLERKQLNFEYRARSTDERTRRTVSPQRITHYRDNWYLDAWDHERDGLRSFAVDRVSNARLIEEPARARNLPLDVRGTAFQHRVWQALREIPPGGTATYTQIAARIGAPSAIRAVARACASNPAAVLVPCHRVVRKDKSLAGYRWGLARKRALLEKEQERGGPI